MLGAQTLHLGSHLSDINLENANICSNSESSSSYGLYSVICTLEFPVDILIKYTDFVTIKDYYYYSI